MGEKQKLEVENKTLNDLYSTEPIQVTNVFNDINHWIPWDLRSYNEVQSDTTRLIQKTYISWTDRCGEYSVDLSSFWFDEKPFAVLHQAGDDLDFVVTDRGTYLHFQSFVESLLEVQVPFCEQDPTLESPYQFDFHGVPFSDYYIPPLKCDIQYEVGDKVIAFMRDPRYSRPVKSSCIIVSISKDREEVLVKKGIDSPVFIPANYIICRSEK